MTDAPDLLEDDPGAGSAAKLAALEARARQYLESLGHGDHHEAQGDPVYALFQVATDCCAQASGYRVLYERLRYGEETAEDAPPGPVGDET